MTGQAGISSKPVAQQLHWNVEELETHGIAAPLWRALERASSCVKSEWPLSPDARSVSHDDIGTHLDMLANAVRAVVLGEAPRIQPVAPSVPASRLLTLLRRAFLGEVHLLDEAPEPSQLVEMLQGLERVQTMIEEDAAHKFASRLSAHDGFELIVEVAHDLRSPLASILFLAETLRKGQSGTLNTMQERQLGLVYSAAFGLCSLASDVIELARGGDRLVDTQPIPFSVTDILQSVADIARPMAEEKRLTLRLSPPEMDFRIGQPSALNRVLLNLTTNSIKFTTDGYVELSAKHLSRTKIEFSVRDTGRGIAPGVIASLYEPFRPRDKQGEFLFSSAGLGLSICRKLVEAMGGELQLETAPGQGTRFYFVLDLPLAKRL